MSCEYCSNCNKPIETDGFKRAVNIQTREMRNFYPNDNEAASAIRKFFNRNMFLCSICGGKAIKAMDNALKDAKLGDPDD